MVLLTESCGSLKDLSTPNKGFDACSFYAFGQLGLADSSQVAGSSIPRVCYSGKWPLLYIWSFFFLVRGRLVDLEILSLIPNNDWALGKSNLPDALDIWLAVRKLLCWRYTLLRTSLVQLNLIWLKVARVLLYEMCSMFDDCLAFTQNWNTNTGTY